MAVFHDTVQGVGATAVDLANRVEIGEIELSGTGTILSIRANVANVGTVTPDKPLVGYIMAESKQINIEPFNFPFAPVSPHLGATPSIYVEASRDFICNCQFGVGTKVKFYMVLGVGAPVGAPECSITITYTDGGGTGPQVFMEVLEPSGALSTGDGDRTVLTAVELPGARKLIEIWAYADITAGVADESLVMDIDISSNQFLVSGPCAFGMRPIEGHNATDGRGSSGITFQKTDRDFKPNQTIKATAAITQYDANNAAPEAYVGFIYI